MKREHVLFLCTANSARSQMAEALLRHFAGDRFDAYSAGLHPRPIHPLVHVVMEEIGLDTSRQRSKPIGEFLGTLAVNHAIVVCERAAADCPRMYPFAMHQLYWPFDDPAALQGSEAAQLEKFRQVRDQIRERIESWVAEFEPVNRPAS